MSNALPSEPGHEFVASVVIPAHNEERGIAGNLTALLDGAHALDIIVVTNGCTDRTAEMARGIAASIRVIELSEPSKANAVRVGNAASDVFPRIHLDADVTLSGADLLHLLEPLSRPEILATAPRRVIPRDDCSLLVRWYYDVWEQLPQVRDGLFGRGAFVLSREAQERVSALPHVMSDDLAASDSFSPAERIVVDAATVTVRPPRTVSDLLRRRIRVAAGNAQAGQLGVRRQDSATTTATLLQLAKERPSLIPRLGVFVVITAIARFRARKYIAAGDFTTWQRDESSRS